MERTLYDTDHKAFRESVREYCERVLVKGHDEAVENMHIARDAWLEAGEQGLLGLNVPEQYGGSQAGDYRFNAVLNEELAKVSMAYASCVGIHFDIVAPYLVELGTEEQKQRWLPGFAAGEKVAAIGMTEPSGGSDLAALRTTAKKDGDSYVLNGSKTFITNGGSADLVVVAASTDPSKKAKGVSLFVVEDGTEGFSRGQRLHKIGQPESDTSELFFDDCRIPADNLLGEEGQGFVAMMERLAQERLCVAIHNLAHAREVLDETLTYVKNREAFGRPVGSFQYNKFLLADMVTKADVTQAYLDAAVVAHADRRLTAVDAAKTKLISSDVGCEILDHCVQLHGGYGYMYEYKAARAWADGRVARIWAGSNEIMKEIIGRDLGL